MKNWEEKTRVIEEVKTLLLANAEALRNHKGDLLVFLTQLIEQAGIEGLNLGYNEEKCYLWIRYYDKGVRFYLYGHYGLDYRTLPEYYDGSLSLKQLWYYGNEGTIKDTNKDDDDNGKNDTNG